MEKEWGAPSIDQLALGVESRMIVREQRQFFFIGTEQGVHELVVVFTSRVRPKQTAIKFEQIQHNLGLLFWRGIGRTNLVGQRG